MITASHLPYYRNGLKFFTKEGGLEKGDIKELTKLADEIASKDASVSDSDIPSCDFMDTYASYLQAKIRDGVGKGDRPLEGLKIIVDAGNGAGGFYVSKVLEPLGADTTGSQFLEPDGSFPNHILRIKKLQLLLRRQLLNQEQTLESYLIQMLTELELFFQAERHLQEMTLSQSFL